EESRRQVRTLFDERVTDVTTRRQLRESWGLCNWHTWIAVDTRPTASGIAILYEDLLRVCHERVRDRRDRRPGPMTRLRAWLRGFAVQAPAGPVSSVVADYGARPRCALCAQLRISEAHCLDALLRFAEDPELDQ